MAAGDAICAPATPQGRSALAVIRASGAGVVEKIAGAFKTRDGKTALDLNPRTAHYGGFSCGDTVIDDIVFVKFLAPASFTGEDSFEISCHGNPIIIRQILEALYSLGFRPALAGEFTRRAYLNGKLGLDAAQAVAEIIEARNSEGLRAARRLSSGTFRSGLLQLRSNLMNLLADLNAELDFIDEDITFASKEAKLRTLSETIATVTRLVADAERFDALKNGVHIAIVGKPNAGKSSLMNRLLGEDRSIVSEIAGTTRDYIEGELTLAGYNVRLFDTAGLNEQSRDPIEQIGIERTRELMGRAHICIRLLDGSAAPEAPAAKSQADEIIVVNKVDILHAGWQGSDAARISAKTGQGMGDLTTALEKRIMEKAPADALPLNAWQREMLRQITVTLAKAAQAIHDNELPEVVTHTVQAAVNHIAELTGEISSEDILGRIFSRFCIGK